MAEILFNSINVDAYFLEYDDERSGDFAPLRFVPETKMVVLGIIGDGRDLYVYSPATCFCWPISTPGGQRP